MSSTLRARSLATVLCIAAVGSTSALLSGCGGGLAYELKGKPPAAEAVARIDGELQEDSKSTRLSIEVDFLRTPAELAPGGKSFVVWTRKDRVSAWHKVGELAYDAFSRKGGLAELTVAELAFELVVSVEVQAAPTAPSSVIVLSQAVED